MKAFSFVFDLKDSKSELCFDIDNVIYLIYQFEAFKKAKSSNFYHLFPSHNIHNCKLNIKK